MFNNDFDKMVFYVNHVPPAGGLMRGVFLSDDRDPKVPNAITADTARMIFDPKTERLVLQLFNGRVVRLSDDASSFHSVQFDTYQVPLELFQFAPKAKTEDEMFYGELLEALRQASPGSVQQNKLLIEVNRRLPFPWGSPSWC